MTEVPYLYAISGLLKLAPYSCVKVNEIYEAAEKVYSNYPGKGRHQVKTGLPRSSLTCVNAVLIKAEPVLNFLRKAATGPTRSEASRSVRFSPIIALYPIVETDLTKY